MVSEEHCGSTKEKDLYLTIFIPQKSLKKRGPGMEVALTPLFLRPMKV